MLHKAESETDSVAIEVLKRDGPIAQDGWRCPLANHQPDPAALDAKHRETLGAVERLTGAKCETCPSFYARLRWVHEAVNARRWRDKGALRERVGWPSTALIRAIDLVDRGDNARQIDDLERQKRDSEARAEEAKRARDNGR
jgi:hypothetical protein